MDINFDEQTEVLKHLDKAREILRASKHDRLGSDFKKAEILNRLDATFHAIQILDTQPY